MWACLTTSTQPIWICFSAFSIKKYFGFLVYSSSIEYSYCDQLTTTKPTLVEFFKFNKNFASKSLSVLFLLRCAHQNSTKVHTFFDWTMWPISCFPKPYIPALHLRMLIYIILMSTVYQIKNIIVDECSVKFLCLIMLYCIADPSDFVSSYHLNQVSSWRDFMKGGKKV